MESSLMRQPRRPQSNCRPVPSPPYSSPAYPGSPRRPRSRMAARFSFKGSSQERCSPHRPMVFSRLKAWPRIRIRDEPRLSPSTVSSPLPAVPSCLGT